MKNETKKEATEERGTSALTRLLGTREVRFRIWDGIEMDYYPWIREGSKINRWLNNGSYKIMQFTGLKDKNGEEIYEGDILKLNGGADDIFGAVGFKDGCFVFGVPWINREEQPYPELKYYVGMSFCEVEVIGNIFENPELLDECT